MVPVIVLMGILSVTLLSRGATAIRLPDASATLAVVGGWLLASAKRTALARAIALVVLLLTVRAAVILGDVESRWDSSDLDGGLRAALNHTQRVARQLAVSPPLRGLPSLDHPGSLRLAEYVSSCTAPQDRVFIFGNYPEVYFFAGRPFAGSHVWLVPGFYSSSRDQQTIVARLQRWPVPIVITEPHAEYDDAYRRHFPDVTAFLDGRYRDAGDVAFGDIELRVLVDAKRRPSGTFRSSRGASLPCFSDSGALHVAAQTP
jgi:hypothetical protein